MQASEEKEAKTEKAGRGVLYPNRVQDRFTSARFAPSPALAGWIEHFWTVAWCLPAGEIFYQETLPYPCVHVAFESNHSEVVCVMRGRFRRRLAGSGRVWGVRFQAGAFHTWLPEDQASLRDQRIAVTRVLPDLDVPGFERQLFAEASAEAMVRALDELFSAAAHSLDEHPTAALVRTCYRLIASDTTIGQVQQLSDQVGLPVRSLQRHFARYLGVSPKWVIQRLRLQDGLERVQDETRTPLHQIAADLGYADQAHFTRDFKAVVGVTPRAYQTTDWRHRSG